MDTLILSELLQALEKAKNPVKKSNEQIAVSIIKDWLPDIENKYPEQVILIRDILDTIEE